METKVESTGFMQLGKTFAVIFNDANYEDEVELQLGDYEIEVRDGKTYAVRKTPKYPKTYEDCCDILSIIPYYKLRYHTFEHGFHELATSNDLLSLQDILDIFGKLLICRKAYWKIAGEELGLDKPWKPDWENDSPKYYISFYGNEEDKGIINYSNKILVFPTEEMRDAFYENFEDFIEYCKELL